MKLFSITFFSLLSFFFAHSQEVESDLIKQRDSFRLAMEQRLLERKQQQEIYQQMYERDPKGTLDSIRNAHMARIMKVGLERLNAYRRNDRLDTLKEIDLSYAGLEQIPDFVYEAKGLEMLNIDYNNIKLLPGKLKSIRHLKKISWRANNLEDVWWIRITNLDHLESLNLENNKLTHLPISIRKLNSINEILLGSNLFEEIPVKRLSKMDSLKKMSMNNCRHLTLSEGDYGQLSRIKELSITHAQLKSIDPSLFEMSGLEELQLSDNEIDSIPAGISGLINLKKLSFYKNKLTSLPEDIGGLKSLESIDLYYNNLERLPESIGGLERLNVLYAAHNRLFHIPESIGNLKKLQELYLHHNRISVLPEKLQLLDSLQVIRVNNNYLLDFPSSVLGLEMLRDIDISNNQIAVIPIGLSSLSRLELFTYHDNLIDFDAMANNQLLSMLNGLGERGVICVPAVKMQMSDSIQ